MNTETDFEQKWYIVQECSLRIYLRILMIHIRGIQRENTLKDTLYCPNDTMLMTYNVSCPGI